MDFFKPGSTLKREDPKTHSYEYNRARDSYRKQLETFKIRFEAELAKHDKLDFDAKQEIRIRAKRIREICLANYRESLQGLATTNHRRNYKDIFLGSRETSFEMHDTNILDYELRLASEIDTLISNLNLMKEDKSNRETLDWMASLAKQKFSYELFECGEHPKQVDIDLQLEPEVQPSPAFNYDEDVAGPIYLSRRLASRSGSMLSERYVDPMTGDDYPRFNREFNYVKTPLMVDDEVEDDYIPRFGVNRIDTSPPKESLLNVAYRCNRSSHDNAEERNIDRPSERQQRRVENMSLKPPVDVDNEEDVEEFLARSRALLRRSARPSMNVSYLYNDDEDDDDD